MDTASTYGDFTGVLQKPRIKALRDSATLPQDSIRSALNSLERSINIDDASGAALDLIGDIVGQSRALSDAIYLAFFGYQGQNSTTGYGQARYRQYGESTLGGITVLADEEYRGLLRWRKDFIKARGTVNDIKRSVKHIFGDPPQSVKTTGDAEITISLPPRASQSSYLALTKSFIPAPAGVSVRLTINGEEVQ